MDNSTLQNLDFLEARVIDSIQISPRRGEKESYIHLSAEVQRKTRREKKAFVSDQYKEIEENNGLGKTRDLCNKVRDKKGTLHAKMGTIKDTKGMDLTETEDNKKRA